MPWYPGKFVERMRQGIRSQYWEEATPERLLVDFEDVLYYIMRDLREAINHMNSAGHELAEISRQLGLLYQINEKLGGKYSELIDRIMNEIKPVFGTMPIQQLESLYDRLLDERRKLLRKLKERQKGSEIP